MITCIILTIISFLALPFILHIIGWWISSAIKKKDKGWGKHFGKHIEVSVTSDPSLMLSKYRYYKWYYEEEMIDSDMYSHNITLNIGGFRWRIKYGHNPIDKEDDYYGDFCESSNYGFYSIDGEKFWRDIWWGNKIYNNPFTTTKFLGCQVLDVDNGKLIEKNKLMSYEKSYDPSLKFPYVYEKKNCIYINKNCEKQVVPIIQFYYEMRSWTCPILYWLKLSWLYQLKRVELSFEISQDGSETFNGIGVIKNDWKGGVYGSSVCINDYPDLYKMFILVSQGYMNNVSRFKNMTKEFIRSFMLYKRKY